jgi:DNA-binding MarR family transcriptional regulator
MPSAPTQMRYLELLRKQPLTSADVITRTGDTSSAVYSTLNILRTKGLIETRVDEADGQRKNYVVTK